MIVLIIHWIKKLQSLSVMSQNLTEFSFQFTQEVNWIGEYIVKETLRIFRNYWGEISDILQIFL